MKYIRKHLPEVEVVEIKENTFDEDGNKVAGRVVYINEYGAKGVKTYDQFFDKYRPLCEKLLLEASVEDLTTFEECIDIPEDVKEEVEAVKLVVERARKENLGAGFSKQLRPAEIRYRLQQVREEAIKEKKL